MHTDYIYSLCSFCSTCILAKIKCLYRLCLRSCKYAIMKSGICFLIHRVRAFLSVLTFPHNFVIKLYGFEGLSLEARYDL